MGTKVCGLSFVETADKTNDGKSGHIGTSNTQRYEKEAAMLSSKGLVLTASISFWVVVDSFWINIINCVQLTISCV
jgi:hypothetical protein